MGKLQKHWCGAVEISAASTSDSAVLDVWFHLRDGADRQTEAPPRDKVYFRELESKEIAGPAAGWDIPVSIKSIALIMTEIKHPTWPGTACQFFRQQLLECL